MTWVPVDACTLPTEEQPTRTAELDALFADVQPPTTTAVLRLAAAPGVGARTHDLAARETACCSWFAFDVAETAEANVVAVSVPPGREDVLSGLCARAAGLASGA